MQFSNKQVIVSLIIGLVFGALCFWLTTEFMKLRMVVYVHENNFRELDALLNSRVLPVTEQIIRNAQQNQP